MFMLKLINGFKQKHKSKRNKLNKFVRNVNEVIELFNNEDIEREMI
jgi:hypothetical protein